MMNGEWLPRRRDQWMYRIFGPTTLHLQHEFYLLLALSLLTVSSLQALYKGSLGLVGDFHLVFLAALWLSRYALLRWLCTWDNSTSRSPTVGGVLAHWITSSVVAGQYFDRPNPQVVARQIGAQHTDDGRTGATLSSFFSPSILFTWQLAKVWIWNPIVALEENVWGILNESGRRRSVSSGTESRRGLERTTSSTSLGLNQAYSYWNKFWSMYGPSLQMIIPVTTMAFYLWYLFFSRTQTDVSHALTMNTRSQPHEMNAFGSKPYGAYKKMETPLWSQVLFYLSCGGTLASILLYGRVILPIADLVAGNNVLKSVRNESKVYGSQPTAAKSAKSKTQRENIDLPWAEQYKSIVGENRFRLICKIAVVRLLENVFVCALLPRTGFSCRFTGHCPEGSPLVELAKVFFPVGITTPLRSDGSYQNQFALITPDRGAAFMTIMSVIIITLSILLAQAATLNRSYMGIMGYIAGEWTVVDSSDPSLAGATPAQWDPRRRYKKGDFIVQNFPGFGGQSIYKATSNSPEGRPFDLYLRATHDLFRNELGHPATSNVITFASGAQLGMVMILILMILSYQLLDYNYGSLVWTLAANIIAAYGTISITLPDYGELDKLVQEISG